MTAKMYKPKEVADLLDMNVQTIRKYLRENRIAHYKIARNYFVSESQLKEFIGYEVKEVKK